MKKLFGKALAMAVMMSVFAGGSAYAAQNSIIIQGTGVSVEEGSGVARIFLENDKKQEAVIWPTFIRFHSTDSADKSEADYAHDYIRLTNSDGKETLYIDNNGLLGTAGDADIGGNLTVKGTITAGTSGAIASGDTGIVTGGAVYTYLESQNYLTAHQDISGKANVGDSYTKAESDAKYLTEHQDISGKANVGDSYTKAESDAKYLTEHQDISGKANVGDSYTKAESDAKYLTEHQDISGKADKSALETEATTRQDADDNLQSQIDTLSSSASAGMSELASKINQTDARVDRVGATAAALAAINYQPMAKGQSQVAIGMGGYNGKKATAIGLAYQFDNRISGSVAGAANGSEHMFNVGFNYLFGQHTAKDIAPMAASNSVSLKEAELQAQVDSMKNEIAELKAMVKALAAK